MSDVVLEVKRDLTEEFTNMSEFLGINQTMVRIYMTLFFSEEPLGLKEISKETGYSTSTVCNTMNVVEAMMDVRRFQKPGSKKIYFECFHDLKYVQNKKITRAIEQIKSLTQKVEEAQEKLKTSKDPKAEKIKENLKELTGAYGKFMKFLPLMEKIMGVTKYGKD